MNEQQIRELVIASLTQIAPEADLSSLQPDIRFRDQFDFDSIDCLNLVTALGKELGIEIPEIDYPKLGTLNGCIRYLTE
jgi:acyl carrier protein